MARSALGCEAVVGSLVSSRKKEYRLTNRMQEGKRPLYAIVFNFIDSRYHDVFATVGGNRVGIDLLLHQLCNISPFFVPSQPLGISKRVNNLHTLCLFI